MAGGDECSSQDMVTLALMGSRIVLLGEVGEGIDLSYKVPLFLESKVPEILGQLYLCTLEVGVRQVSGHSFNEEYSNLKR